MSVLLKEKFLDKLKELLQLFKNQNNLELLEMCCVIFTHIVKNGKSVEFIQENGEMDRYLKMFYELLDKNGPIKVACIEIFYNIAKNSKSDVIESLNNVAKNYAMNKNKKVYESVIDLTDDSTEIVFAHVNLFNEMIQDCGDDA